jgi:hypothetical protein
LPVEFRTANFASFSRQLNLYGFAKISPRCYNRRNASSKTVAVPSVYSHPLFNRDDRDLATSISRNSKENAGASVRRPIGPITRPNSAASSENEKIRGSEKSRGIIAEDSGSDYEPELINHVDSAAFDEFLQVS